MGPETLFRPRILWAMSNRRAVSVENPAGNLVQGTNLRSTNYGEVLLIYVVC